MRVRNFIDVKTASACVCAKVKQHTNASHALEAQNL